VIAGGEAEIRRDGRVLRVLGPGGGFGEFALFRDGPRTATVAAVERLCVSGIRREDFLAAVTGHPAAAAEATRP
jgi:trk system potassium uptake protein TrkA